MVVAAAAAVAPVLAIVHHLAVVAHTQVAAIAPAIPVLVVALAILALVVVQAVTQALAVVALVVIRVLAVAPAATRALAADHTPLPVLALQAHARRLIPIPLQLALMADLQAVALAEVPWVRLLVQVLFPMQFVARRPLVVTAA